MAAKVPLAVTSTAGYVQPTGGVYGGPVATTATSLVTNAVILPGRADLKLRIHYFSAIGTDTWVSGDGGIFAVAWQGSQVNADHLGTCLTTQSNGTISSITPGGNKSGWIWTLSRSIGPTTSTAAGSVAPVTDTTTAGYVQPDLGVYGGVCAITTDLTSKPTGVTHHSNRSDMKLRIYYFTDIDDGDTWTSGIPGIVALAWQHNVASTNRACAGLTDAESATAPYGGEITFDTSQADVSGWLWVLSRG